LGLRLSEGLGLIAQVKGGFVSNLPVHHRAEYSAFGASISNVQPMNCRGIFIEGEPDTDICDLALAGDALVLLCFQAFFPVFLAVADKVLGTALLAFSLGHSFVRLDFEEEANSAALAL